MIAEEVIIAYFVKVNNHTHKMCCFAFVYVDLRSGKR